MPDLTFSRSSRTPARKPHPSLAGEHVQQFRHRIPSEFRKRPVAIDIVGCGGTGSRLLPRLAELDYALRQFGEPGLYLMVFDPDIVTEANVGRTLFTASDVGQYKVAVAVDRLNRVYQTMYRSEPKRYEYGIYNPERLGAMPDIVITCTDSLRSRVEIFAQMMASGRIPPKYWIDCGNDSHTGQVIMGEIDGHMGRSTPYLPTVIDVFPDMQERALVEEEEPESCTLVDALLRQSLFINQRVALECAELLGLLFFQGGLNHHGVYVNGKTGRTNPRMIPIPGHEPPPAPTAAPAVPLRERRLQRLSMRRVLPDVGRRGER